MYQEGRVHTKGPAPSTPKKKSAPRSHFVRKQQSQRHDRQTKSSAYVSSHFSRGVAKEQGGAFTWRQSHDSSQVSPCKPSVRSSSQFSRDQGQNRNKSQSHLGFSKRTSINPRQSKQFLVGKRHSRSPLFRKGMSPSVKSPLRKRQRQ